MGNGGSPFCLDIEFGANPIGQRANPQKTISFFQKLSVSHTLSLSLPQTLFSPRPRKKSSVHPVFSPSYSSDTDVWSRFVRTYSGRTNNAFFVPSGRCYLYGLVLAVSCLYDDTSLNKPPITSISHVVRNNTANTSSQVALINVPASRSWPTTFRSKGAPTRDRVTTVQTPPLAGTLVPISP